MRARLWVVTMKLEEWRVCVVFELSTCCDCRRAGDEPRGERRADKEYTPGVIARRG